MMPRALLSVLCSLPALLAQAPDAAVPLLRLQTHNQRLLQAVATLFGAEIPAPAPATGLERGCELIVRHDLAVDCRELAEGPAADTTELMLHPAGLAKALAPKLAALQAPLGAQVGALLQPFGFAPALGRHLVADLVALLPQIGGVYATLAGDPQQPGRGLLLRLDLVPEPDTPFRRWVEQLAPNRDGVPVLPGDAAVASLQLSLDADFLYPLVQPFLGIASRYGTEDEAQRQQAADWIDRMLTAWDGAASLRLQDGDLLLLLGTRDAAAFAKAQLDPRHLELQRQSAQRRQLELAFAPAALTHRGVELLQTVSSAPAAPSVTSWSGVAAGLAFTVGGKQTGADAARLVVDAVVDGKVQRQRGPRVLTLAIDLEHLPAATPAAGAAAAPPARRLQLLIDKVGLTLKLRCELR